MNTTVADFSLASWTVSRSTTSRCAARISVRNRDGLAPEVTLERCAAGRLRDAYPVSEHDLEARVSELPAAALGPLLAELATAVFTADHRCRRLVFAAPEGELALLSAAEEAGFRYVVDVDLPEGPVSLAVAEPGWVTAVDMDLDRVPQA